LLLAVAFFQMSRKRWFPVPLFFAHAALVLYHLSIALMSPSPYWVQALLNRSFEMTMIYIIACAAYRIMRLRDSRAAG